MPTSTPRKKPTDFKKKKAVSAAAAFKKANKSASSEVELPSGNVVRVKQISMTDLLSENIIPDTLTAIVSESLSDGGKKKKKASDEEVKTLLQNPKQLSDMFDVFDRVAAKVVLEPEFVYHRELILDDDGNPGITEEWQTIPEEDRDEEVVYTDEVTLDDKSFLFQFSVGGTQDLERFRAETRAAVGELESSESVQPTTE